jgi:uncharacterized tellurite resistance protein B-like protein
MPEDINAAEPPLTQPQREAIFDFLLLGMYADSHLKLSENERLYDLMASVGWESYQDPREYSDTAISRVREAAETGAGTTEFLKELHVRLDNPEARNFALVLFLRMVEADKTVNAAEDKLYTAAKTVFGL